MHPETIKHYCDSPQSLISFIKNSNDFWSIKNHEAKYIFVNNASLTNSKLPLNFNFDGKLDKEIPNDICEELWPDFLEQDLNVISENKKLASIDVHFYGEGNNGHTLIPCLCQKIPLYDDNKNVIGVICHGVRLDAPALLYYLNRLNRKTIQIDAPHDLFTKRELEVIFWLQQRLQKKEIAKRLEITTQTVEVHIKHIYEKADVHGLFQFIDYCKSTGLDTYIPRDFIRKGVQLLSDVD